MAEDVYEVPASVIKELRKFLDDLSSDDPHTRIGAYQTQASELLEELEEEDD